MIYAIQRMLEYQMPAGRGRKRDQELENRSTRNSELDLRYSSIISKEDSIFLAV